MQTTAQVTLYFTFRYICVLFLFLSLLSRSFLLFVFITWRCFVQNVACYLFLLCASYLLFEQLNDLHCCTGELLFNAHCNVKNVTLVERKRAMKMKTATGKSGSVRGSQMSVVLCTKCFWQNRWKYVDYNWKMNRRFFFHFFFLSFFHFLFFSSIFSFFFAFLQKFWFASESF